MTYKNLITTLEEGILIITINRPDKLNALNIETMGEIKSAMESAIKDENVKGIIFTGAGDKAFVAGADIFEIAALNGDTAKQFSERGQKIFSLIENSPKPVVAAVNGFALGGGCELAMACHIRIASENAQFGQPEVNLGIIPGYGGTQRLTRLAGKGKALEMMLTGDRIKADEALRIGLVNHVVNANEILPRTKEILKKCFSKAPLALAKVIEAVNVCTDEPEEGYEAEAKLFGDCSATEDFKEGTSAFLEKRKPAFKGK